MDKTKEKLNICLTSDGLWQAQIRYKNKSIYLGKYYDECQAAKAYDTAAIEFYGEYPCVLNLKI